MTYYRILQLCLCIVLVIDISGALKALERFVPRLIETKLPYEDKGSVMERIIEGASKEVIQLHKFKKILNE